VPFDARRVPDAARTPRAPGIHDVYLTEYGKLQARRAGQVRSRRRAGRNGVRGVWRLQFPAQRTRTRALLPRR
jgi:hypothetical protein